MFLLIQSNQYDYENKEVDNLGLFSTKYAAVEYLKANYDLKDYTLDEYGCWKRRIRNHEDGFEIEEVEVLG